MSQPENHSFTEFIQTVRWAFRTCMQIDRTAFLISLVTEVIQNQQSLIYAVIYAKAIDAMINLAQNPQLGIESVYPVLVMFMAYNIFEALNNGISAYYISRVNFGFRRRLPTLIYKQLDAIGIESIENPEVSNLITRTETNINNVDPLSREIISFCSQVVGLITSGLIIITFAPLLIPFLALFAIIKSFPEKHYNQKDFRFHFNNSELARHSGWHLSYLQQPKILLEVKILGGYKYFDSKINDFIDYWISGILQIKYTKAIFRFIFRLSDSAVVIFIYLSVFKSIIDQLISVGTAQLYIRSVNIFTDKISWAINSYAIIYEFSLQMMDVRKFFELKPSHVDGHIELPRFISGPSIEIKNMDFAYPESEKLIYKDLNLSIKAGEKIAIVGHNGAGKTTLVKLLARIHKVTAGEILVNGNNIMDLKLDDWYKNIGVLMQEYNTFSNLTVRDNVHLGRPMKDIDNDKVIEALKNADAWDFVQEYPDKLDQLLSERFKGGIRPSTGQAQKIAIARFFYRNASVLIFDEPTSAIDAVSEYNIFNRIYEFFKNKTVIIISHRFSTVRSADRIIHIEKGEIIEEGTHQELMALEGKYAEAFRIQAEGYSK